MERLLLNYLPWKDNFLPVLPHLSSITVKAIATQAVTQAKNLRVVFLQGE